MKEFLINFVLHTLAGAALFAIVAAAIWGFTALLAHFGAWAILAIPPAWGLWAAVEEAI